MRVSFTAYRLALHRPIGNCHGHDGIVCKITGRRKHRKIVIAGIVEFVYGAHNVTNNCT